MLTGTVRATFPPAPTAVGRSVRAEPRVSAGEGCRGRSPGLFALPSPRPNGGGVHSEAWRWMIYAERVAAMRAGRSWAVCSNVSNVRVCPSQR